VHADRGPSEERTGKRPGKRRDVHERALGLLAVRQRSRKELERRLVQAGFDRDEVDTELSRLEQVGLIDEEAFARAVVQSRMGSRAESRRVVAGKLAQAGVDPDAASAALDDAVEDDEERAFRLAEAKAARLRGGDPAVAFRRLFGLLARRGYAPELARRAASRALAVEAMED
jgi:regulatory protein